jgi:hypothetical protein
MYQIPNIRIETWCLNDFESDNNVFWCEAGTPVFVISGVMKTFAEWQALGYDTHSIVVTPGFVNTSDFVPATRLDYGTDLGAEFQTGLSVSAEWSSNNPSTAAQNGPWQAGARVFAPDSGDQIIKIYPNPASNQIYISIKDPTVVIDYIRIISLSRNIVFQDEVDPDVRDFQIRMSLLPGFYILQMGLNNRRPRFTEKLVITN